VISSSGSLESLDLYKMGFKEIRGIFNLLRADFKKSGAV
jgi:hypothetical protein